MGSLWLHGLQAKNIWRGKKFKLWLKAGCNEGKWDMAADIMWRNKKLQPNDEKWQMVGSLIQGVQLLKFARFAAFLSSVNNVFIGFIFVGQTRQFQNVKLGSGKLWTGIFHHFKNENGCQLPQPPQENPISMQAHTQKPNRWPIQRPRGEKTKFVSWWNQKAKA